ncbi:tyrosine-type recombinase/integrase [Alsobacter sp. R-9]
MSGGPYGRGKAPERACMKVADWPAIDRRLWQEALMPVDPFEPTGGTRAGHSRASNVKTEKGYGRWLTWLATTGQLDADAAPHSRITRDRVKAYVEHLEGLGNGGQSILSRLQELGDFARAVTPDRDWSFINRIASKVRARTVPVRDKRAKLATTMELLGLGLDLMENAPNLSTPRLAALAYRDGLTIALLALRPLRRRNLAGLVLGDTLMQVGDAWMLRIAPEDTKTHQPIDMPCPAALTNQLGVYLAVHRPVLANLRGRWARPIGEALWVSSHGSPMTKSALYNQVRQRTREGLGKDVNPHLFRDAAATTLAVEDPQHVRLATPLLGHRHTATTERHYQQAQALEAHREFVEALRKAGGDGGDR